jgi:hypothetical protein
MLRIVIIKNPYPNKLKSANTAISSKIKEISLVLGSRR